MAKKDTLIDMGLRLKSVRKVLKIQQKEMAEALHMSSSYLSEVENGRGNPGSVFFIKLASEYKICANYLLLGGDDMFIRIGAGDNVTPQETNIAEGIDSIEKLVWLMERSIYFKYNDILCQ
ncbi:MAG: helix-turn-helix domain-containing protein [Acidobacteria bacterium]|nr:helix-turn-helix domain-containing protein [Acidobacteriota bacterium]